MFVEQFVPNPFQAVYGHALRDGALVNDRLRLRWWFYAVVMELKHPYLLVMLCPL